MGNRAADELNSMPQIGCAFARFHGAEVALQRHQLTQKQGGMNGFEDVAGHYNATHL